MDLALQSTVSVHVLRRDDCTYFFIRYLLLYMYQVVMTIFNIDQRCREKSKNTGIKSITTNYFTNLLIYTNLHIYTRTLYLMFLVLSSVARTVSINVSESTSSTNAAKASEEYTLASPSLLLGGS